MEYGVALAEYRLRALCGAGALTYLVVFVVEDFLHDGHHQQL